MSDEDLFGSDTDGAAVGNAPPVPEKAMDVLDPASGGAAGSDDENLFGSDDEDGGSQWVNAPKTEEEKLEAILGTNTAAAESSAAQSTRVPEVKMTKGKMFLEKTHTLAKDVSKLHFMKTPRFIKIQSKNFDETNFDAEDERTEFGPLTSDVIRWRYKTDDDGNKVLDDNGKPILESNARLQKLKNGKLQVVIGKSVFDVATEKMLKNYLYMSNLSEPPADGSGLTDEEAADGVNLNESTNLTMACTLDGATRMTIQPRLGSRTHAHVNQAISKKYRKEDRMNVRDVRDILENPEATAEKEEKEERARLLNERKGRDPDRAAYSRREREGRIGMSSDYLNEDQYDEINLSDIKRGVEKKRRGSKKKRDKGRLGELDEGEELDEDDEEDSEDQDGDDDDLDGFIVKGGDEDEEGDEEDEEGESDPDDEPKYFKKGNKAKEDKDDGGEKEKGGGDDSDSDLFASDEEPERQVAKRSLEADEGSGAGTGAAAEGDGAPQRKKVRKGVIAGDSDDE